MQITNNKIKRRSKIQDKYGIIPISVYVMENDCTYDCIYCPKIKDIPKSYLVNEDTLRAKALKYCPFKQIEYWKSIIENQIETSNPVKLEIIILGGTFSNLSKKYRIDFFKEIYDSLNGYKSKSFKLAKINNSNAKFRACVITIETRPDLISIDECEFLLTLGISKIEIGVQSIFNDILEITNRKYTQETIINATKLMKSYGFKIGYHIMLRLPFSSKKKDLWMLNEVTTNSYFLPDYLKIYPLVYFKDKSLQKNLYELYEKHPWNNINVNSIVDILASFKSKIPKYIRIQRIGRQFENSDNLSFLRLKVQEKMKDQNQKCKCLRCREFNTYKTSYNLENIDRYKLNTINYSKNDTFIQVLSTMGILLGYIKLYVADRFIIREIKVVGKASNIGNISNVQGKGIGKMLIEEAEKIALKLRYDKVYVNASPGVYSFYLKMNYKIEKLILSKKI